LTTYLSLAGRYTVLMPNTGRGGGISRKITQAQDRKRLKSIAQELDVPEGMGLIIRTAGAARTNQEIRRDYEYLLRLWESVRDLTLESTAPSLVYEEGNLIKRSIRDQYTKDIDEIVVAGAQAHRDAYDFMKMLMPSQAKNVLLHDRPEPLFSRYPVVERQLNAMFSPYVTLRSGGYLVINQTEALVAIDINSGKSTREFSIEETALNTNLEAADEIARQLKLRDLAGLIVVDFIDMEERRNNRKVENRLKDALRHDRARIQVGRISHFGLLEMSRQRMRTGVLEGSTSQCPHCQGTGIIRSVESVSLAVLRGLEDHLQRDARSSVNVLTSAEVALYILNHKRSFIIEMERRFGVSIAVLASDRMQGANFAVEKSAAPVQPKRQQEREAVNMNWGFSGDANEAIEPGTEEDDPRPDSVAAARGEETSIDEIDDGEGSEDRGEARGDGQDGGGRRRRRRRGRGRGRDDDRGSDRGGERFAARDGRGEGDQPRRSEDVPLDRDEAGADRAEMAEADEVEGAHGGAAQAGDGQNGDGRPRRRRGRRGGRRGRDRDRGPDAYAHGGQRAQRAYESSGEASDTLPQDVGSSDDRHDAAPIEVERDRFVDEPPAETREPEVVALAEPVQPNIPEIVPPKEIVVESAQEDPARPARRGWWQRRSG
jgi:ribonuclease E